MNQMQMQQQMINQMQQMIQQMQNSQMNMPKKEAPEPKTINVKPIPQNILTEGQLSFEEQEENRELIMGVPLEVSVEIGRTRKLVKEILEFTKGSLVILDIRCMFSFLVLIHSCTSRTFIDANTQPQFFLGDLCFFTHLFEPRWNRVVGRHL